MKKILLATWVFGNGNYGQTLQAYALNMVLENMGYNPFLLITETEYETYLEIIGDNPFMIKCEKIEWERIYANNQDLIKRLSVFDKFVRMNFSFKEKLTDIDIVCFGSDQLWNPIYDSKLMKTVDDFQLNSVGKFSYATSTGAGNFNSELMVIFDKYCKSISNLNNISVREKESIKLINDSFNRGGLKDRNIEVVVDPVFLLSQSEWKELAECSEFIQGKEKYIFGYFVGNLNKQRRKCLKKIAENLHLKLIIVELNCDGESYMSDVSFPDPLGFVKMIEKSEIVVGDSYHAAVFSIIFNKQFYLFSRIDKAEWHYENDLRIKHLLGDLDVGDRFVGDYIDFLALKDIDYADVDKLLEEKIKYSKSYLNNALKECWEITCANRLVKNEYLQYEYPKEVINEGDKIILYGAGNVGKNIWAQSIAYNYANVVGWVDANAKKYADLELDIMGANTLFEDYDYYFIAIRDKEVAKSAITYLESIGIDKEKIKWCRIDVKHIAS